MDLSATNVSTESDSPVHKWSRNEVDFIELWKKLNEGLKVEEVELVAYTMRRIRYG